MTKVNPNAKSKKERNSLLYESKKSEKPSLLQEAKNKLPAKSNAPVGGKTRNRQFSLLKEETQLLNTPDPAPKKTEADRKPADLPLRSGSSAEKPIIIQRSNTFKKDQAPVSTVLRQQLEQKATADKAAKLSAPKTSVKRPESELVTIISDKTQEVPSSDKKPELKPSAAKTAPAPKSKSAPAVKTPVKKAEPVPVVMPPLQKTEPKAQTTPQAAPPERKLRPAAKKKSKAPLIAVIIVVACLAAAYVGGIFYWKDQFLPNTYINDQNVSRMEAVEADAVLLPQNTDYAITELTGTETIPLADFQYTLTYERPLETIIAEQNYYLWPVSLFRQMHYDNAISISYDENLLKKALLSLDAFNEDLVVKPKDAYLGKNKEGHYEIIPEVNGNQLDEKKVFAYVKDSVEGGNYSIDLTETDSYLKPSVLSDNKELAEDLKFVQAIGEETITIDLTGAQEVLEPFDLKDLVSLDANNEILIDEEALWNYVTELSNQYNTYLSERDFTTHSGAIIKVGGNRTEDYGIDTYGFLMNRSATAEILRGCILSKSDQTMTPAWDVPALTRDSVNGDIGDTYIEISLSEQHLWYYTNGNLFFEADVVTGLDTDQRRTPWGVFRAYEKDKDCTLKGEMAGERWNTHVDYWISVTWTGCGIHDATWQPGFGGDLYKSIGSHGCINVSLDTAKTLYDTVEVDTPIIIY